jgi:hypothetical protein
MGVLARKNVVTGKTEWNKMYHMTVPTRITMAERREMVDSVVKLVKEVQREFPWVEVVYLTPVLSTWRKGT